MKSVRERMDILSAYREVGTYHAAAEICSTTPKTVKRVVEAAERSEPRPPPAHNYDEVADLVAQRVGKTKGRISAKRLLPAARAAGAPMKSKNTPNPTPAATAEAMPRRGGTRMLMVDDPQA